MKKKLLALVLITALLLTMATGCGGGGTGEVKDSVVIAVSSDMDSLDPLHTSGGVDYQIYRNLFDTLVKESGDGVEPSIAESWSVSEDGMSYTFNLRDDVKFHDGTVLTADDVVFSISTAQESPYWADHTAAIKEAVALDDTTVKVELKYPYAPFLLAMTSICIVPEEAYTKAGDSFAQNPVGSGPYQFVSRQTGQNVVLTRFDDYFGDKASIKDVTFEVITESSTTLVALETGEVDFAQDIAMSQVSVAQENEDLKVEVLESTGLICLAMNNEAEPFTDVRVRQAFNYAINKENVITISQNGMASPAVSPFNEAYFGYSDQIKGYEYNVEKAKELLAEAGYPDGFEITLKIYDALSLPKDAQAIQEDLRNINVTVNIEMMEGNAYLQDMFNGNYEMGIVSISSSMPDVDNWDQFLVTDAGMNLFQYSNSEVDRIFEEAKKMNDDDKRSAVYEELTQILVDDAAMVPLYFISRTYVTNKDLEVKDLGTNGVHGVAAYCLSWKE